MIALIDQLCDNYTARHAMFCILHVIRQIEITGNSMSYGSGFIVSDGENFFLLTCCHNFLEVEDSKKVRSLEDDYVADEMKEKFRRAEYLFSTRDFRSTVALKAEVVLTNCKDPELIIDKVGNS